MEIGDIWGNVDGIYNKFATLSSLTHVGGMQAGGCRWLSGTRNVSQVVYRTCTAQQLLWQLSMDVYIYIQQW